MTQPTPYDRQFDFTEFSTDHPVDQQPGVEIDAEFDAVKVALDETQANLALIQRDDGALRNGIVRRDAMNADVIQGINTPTPWVPAAFYTVRDSVLVDDAWYWAKVSHTSSADFATDLTAGRWQMINDFSEMVQDATDAADAAAASALAAAASETAAAGSASSASSSASAAASSASDAAADAVAAAGSASSASTSATNAGNSATAAAGSASTASTAATNAGNSATAAAGSASTASTAATNAGNSATAAAGSASTASTQATNASNSASAASTSATNASNSASAASTSATNAGNSATAAAGSASAASAYALGPTTSATSLTIGTGSKSFTTAASLSLAVGAYVKLTHRSNATNWMIGDITTVTSSTSFTVNVTDTSGSGTINDWSVQISGAPGAGAQAWWTPTGIKTADYTAVSGEMVLVNTTGGAVTISLPATPATNARVAILDVGRAAATNAITVDRNGATIDGAASNATITRAGQVVMLIYTGTTWATDRTRHIDVYQIACSNLTSTLTTGTTKAYYRLPFAGTLITYRAALLTASSSGALTIDVNLNGTTTMSATKLTVDASATTSVSATQPVLTTTATADDDVIAIDIDAAGTGAKGLVVTIYHLRA